MNRHTSNPFLSDWDDATPVQQSPVQQDAGAQQQARRSSCSQTELGPSSAAGAAARQGLYRRNMSSFEAASLQLEQQQQMLENGSTVGALHSNLIAKMTADFQAAISNNDKQFALDTEHLGFNPFDPFETIVDDDVSLPSPASTNDAGASPRASVSNGDASARRKHDSIDDDDDELVSTPVRNIKSSEMVGNKALPISKDSAEPESGNSCAGHAFECASANVDDTAASPRQDGSAPNSADSDSRAKASLFASLLASAENSANQTQASASHQIGLDADTQNSSSERDGDASADYNTLNQMVENPTHVIKGSPNSAGGTDERSVGFFDPFETVIDKDALSELMSGGAGDNDDVIELNQAQQDGAAPSESATGQIRPSSRAVARRSLAAGCSIAESASIETVIDKEVTTPRRDEMGDDREGDAKNAEPARGETQTAVSKRALQYDSAMALGRPTGRKLEQPTSGFTAPQPTPLRRPRQKATPSKQKASNRDDNSSSSDEEDDRIQIVIRAKENKLDDNGDAIGQGQQAQQPTIVPLLPPPPSKSSMKQARERGQVEDMPSPIMSYKSRQAARKTRRASSSSSSSSIVSSLTGECNEKGAARAITPSLDKNIVKQPDQDIDSGEETGAQDDDGQFVIPMRRSDIEDEDGDNYGKSDTPLYDDDTSYVLEDFPPKYEGDGWEIMLRYPPKKKLTSNRFWKKIFVKLAQVPLVVDVKTKQQSDGHNQGEQQMCWALQIFDKAEDKKPMQEIPIQATYSVSEINSQLFDQFGKIFTIKLQYIFYKERVGVRQGQLARFIHSGHIGTSTTSGGHGVDPISIGAIRRIGAPIEHSPQVSQIIKLGCTDYDSIKQFKEVLEDCLFRMPIHRDRALSTYKTEEVQMAVRDETYIEVNQIGTITRQMARVRLFFLSFLNGSPTVEVGINDIHRQGREVVSRMDILPVVTEEWIRLEACELHSTVDQNEFAKVDSRLIKLSPPDATFFELMRFRVRPPRNRELPLQISANMSVTRTRVSINCEVMIPGCVSRKHGQIPCENIAIRIPVPECWIYFFREEKHFRMGSKKSVNRRAGKVKGIERFLGGGSAGLQNIDNESSLIEVTSGQAKYEHHHHAIVWRAARWPKENQTAYLQNTMKIRLPLTAYDKMPDSFNEFVYAEYTMPATTVSHTTLRSISIAPCDDEPAEKYVKYSTKYDYKVKMRLSVNLGAGVAPQEPEASPIVIMKQPDLKGDLHKEEDSDDDDDDDDENHVNRTGEPSVVKQSE